jgi:hypothetical protein
MFHSYAAVVLKEVGNPRGLVPNNQNYHDGSSRKFLPDVYWAYGVTVPTHEQVSVRGSEPPVLRSMEAVNQTFPETPARTCGKLNEWRRRVHLLFLFEEQTRGRAGQDQQAENRALRDTN